MNSGRKLMLSAFILALAQIGFLSWIIVGRASVLREGREVLLKVEPIDPRDLLRGDYVRLGYEVASLPNRLIANRPADPNLSQDGSIYLRLGKDADGYWRARLANLYEPPSTPAAAGEVDLRGAIAGGWSLEPTGSLFVDLGIDRFYVPEGEGLAIQEDMRERPFGILAAVDEDGGAHIKALMDGGRKLYEEPFY